MLYERKAESLSPLGYCPGWKQQEEVIRAPVFSSRHVSEPDLGLTQDCVPQWVGDVRVRNAKILLLPGR